MSGKRLYLQLKSANYYNHSRKADGTEVYKFKGKRLAEHLQSLAAPIMLVARASDGQIRWMNVTESLKQRGVQKSQIIFDGEPFSALSVLRVKDKMFA